MSLASFRAAEAREGSPFTSSPTGRFLPATVEPDEEFVSALTAVCSALDLNELHLTGGEPTLHSRISCIVRIGTEAGLRVSMTSNGERGAKVLEDCAEAGLDRVNFSIFGTTASELAQVQHERFADVKRASRKIRAFQDAVSVAERVGVRANANIVVPDDSHAPRVHRLLAQYTPWISVRLLNSLDDGAESVAAIERLLAELGAIPSARYVTAGVSGSRTAYTMPNGRVVCDPFQGR